MAALRFGGDADAEGLLRELKAGLLRRGAAGSRQFAPTDERGSDFRGGQAVAGGRSGGAARRGAGG